MVTQKEFIKHRLHAGGDFRAIIPVIKPMTFADVDTEWSAFTTTTVTIAAINFNFEILTDERV